MPAGDQIERRRFSSFRMHVSKSNQHDNISQKQCDTEPPSEGHCNEQEIQS